MYYFDTMLTIGDIIRIRKEIEECKKIGIII